VSAMLLLQPSVSGLMVSAIRPCYNPPLAAIMLNGELPFPSHREGIEWLLLLLLPLRGE